MLNSDTSSLERGRQATVPMPPRAKGSAPAEQSPREAKTRLHESATTSTPARATLYTLCTTALSITDNDVEAAKARVEQSLADPLIRAGLIDDALASALGAAMASVKSSRRTMIERSALAPVDVMARARAVGIAFLNWPMRSGGILADATREQVIADAEAYQLTANTEARRAAFLRSIAKAMGNAETVREALSEDQAKALWEAANA